MMRDGGLGDRELIAQVLAGAALLVGNGLEHPHAAGVRQGLRDELELPWRESVTGSAPGAHSIIVIELSHGSQATPRPTPFLHCE